MYLHFTNTFIHKLFPHFTWRIPTTQKVIYLTFDDGPIPEVTPWVLAELKKYDAKATFFCVGENVCKNPTIFDQIIREGHLVGNHTFNHLNGWQTDDKDYLANVSLCQHYLADYQKDTKKLFRPPYGKLSTLQSKILRKDYQVVMWDVLSGDFDQKLAKEVCLQKAIHYTQKGSIVVFHDSEKAKKNLYFSLPRYLEYFSNQGFSFIAV
jgi:peptidoglycan/xylan/chitin deacetylase (PgdA/CDA1 family)